MTTETKPAVSGPEMLELAMQGFQLYEQGRYTEAKELFQRLSETDPNEGYYHTALGAVYLAEEALDEAEHHLSRALKLDSKDTAALVNRGEVYLRQGRLIDAAKDFARVVALDPRNEDPLTMRARMLAAAALETIEAAQQEAESDAEALEGE